MFERFLNYLEYKGASKTIPNASKISGRKKLQQNSFPSDAVASFDHGKWDRVLQYHVDVAAGNIDDVKGINMVDYDAIAKDPNFSDYLTQLEEADPTKLYPAEQLAFWINAYNALCINIIIQYETEKSVKIQSITNLTNKDNAVWNQVAGKVAGADISLNTIEHERLRKEWDEPLVHACIVCASASCPNLRPEAFVAARLQEQMEEQMKNWIKNPTKGAKLLDDGKVQLSRIFLWFRDDFGSHEGIANFLLKYWQEEDVKEKLKKQKFSHRYFTYSWKINRTTNKKDWQHDSTPDDSVQLQA